MRFRATRHMLLTLGTALLLSVGATCCAQQAVTRIEHLLEAAVHLEQANLPVQAAEVRGLLAGDDEQAKRRLLEERLAQIEQLRLEVTLLQQALSGSDDRTKVILRIKVLELSLGKLSQVGLNMVSIRQLLESESPTTVVDTGGDILQFLEMLQGLGFAELIAEPTLMTHDGQRATLEIPTKAPGQSDRQFLYLDQAATGRTQPSGLLFECTPTVGQLGLLQLDLALRRSGKLALAAPDRDEATVSPALPPDAATGNESTASPPAGPKDVQTRVDILGSQTLILASRDSNARKNQATVTLLLLETETVAPRKKDERQE